MRTPNMVRLNPTEHDIAIHQALYDMDYVRDELSGENEEAREIRVALERLEDRLSQNPSPKVQEMLLQRKKNMLELRRGLVKRVRKLLRIRDEAFRILYPHGISAPHIP